MTKHLVINVLIIGYYLVIGAWLLVIFNKTQGAKYTNKSVSCQHIRAPLYNIKRRARLNVPYACSEDKANKERIERLEQTT